MAAHASRFSALLTRPKSGRTSGSQGLIRRKRSVRPSTESLEIRITPASFSLAGIATLPNIYSVGAPVVNDQGVGYAAYSLLDGSSGTVGGIAKIYLDGNADPNFATFPTYNANAPDTYQGIPSPQLVGDANSSGFELYGTTGGGGPTRDGTVFAVDASGNISTIATFNNVDTGYGPTDLILENDVLYGTTVGGGLNGDGVIFSVPTGGGTPTVVAGFNGKNGDSPNAGLAYSNGVLYGTTASGGAFGSGTIFSVPASGGAITTLADFPAGTGSNGHVIVNGGFVMGTKYADSLGGSIFRVSTMPGGQIYSVPFGTIDGSGVSPTGLTEDGAMIVGATSLGGTDGTGSVFEVNLPSFTITTLQVFPHHGTAGTFPHGVVSIDSHGNVYGVAHGYEGIATNQAYFWKLSEVGGGGSGGQPGPVQLKAPKMSRPSASTIVNATQPKFHWSRVAGAASYEVLITDITPGISEANTTFLDQEDIPGTSFKPDLPLNPAHYYTVQARAIGSDGEAGPWSNEPKFKIAEQESRSFQIRLDQTLELSAGASYARFVFTVQALTDSHGVRALGPPRIMIFRGPGKSAPTGPINLPVGFSGVTTWDYFKTTKNITIDELDGPGTMTLGPSVTAGPASLSSPTILAFLKKGHHITVTLNVSSSGIGITLLSLYAGDYQVLPAPNYDPDLWPNTIFA